MSERPSKLEPGMRLRLRNDCEGHKAGDVVTVKHETWESENYAEPLIECLPGHSHGLSVFFRFADVVYLGGPTPTPGEGKGMEALGNGRPARCLKCGGEKRGCAWICPTCTKPWPNNLVRDWQDGARDFPRPASPAPVLHTCKHGNVGLCGLCQAETATAPSPEHVHNFSCYASGCISRSRQKTSTAHHGRMVGEMRDASGAPLSALGRIQARKAPEPWRPSVDEDHWIPNVGERGWR